MTSDITSGQSAEHQSTGAADITTEVLVLGSGIGGSTVAAILARQGVRVVVLDAQHHPRFALGESTIGETSVLMRILAARWDVPELAWLSTQRGIAKDASDRCGVKSNFGFVYHRPNAHQDPDEVTQCNVSDGPFGQESHLMRADIDHYLFRAAVKYGALPLEGVKVEQLDFSEDGVSARLNDGRTVYADYVIDATGARSVLAEKFSLREQPARFLTNSRTLFTHMSGVRPFDEIATQTRQPSPWHNGTLHHIFDGGWMWVIPFNNREGSSSNLVSVGLNLDNSRYPKRDGVSPEQEWSDFLSRFPSIAEQFQDAKPELFGGKWVSTDRTQFSSKQTVGDRWILMSHAAGAVDALFSRGMGNTMAVIEAFVPRFLAARSKGDYSSEQFSYVDKLSQTILDNNDKLIAGSYISFRDFDLWRAWSKMWFLAWNLGGMRLNGAYYRFLESGDDAILDELHKGELPGTFAPEAPSAQAQFEKCFDLMLQVDRGERSPRDIIPDLAHILGDGEASPAPLNLHDVLRPWHDGSDETQTLIHNWGQTAAPEAMRKWFDYDRATTPTKAAEEVFRALEQPRV